MCLMTLSENTVEDTLRKQTEQFRALAENSPDIIVRFDRNFRYLYINRPIFNAKIGRIVARIGDSIDDIGLPEDQIELRKQKIRQVFETGQPANAEFEFPGRYGNQWFDARFVPEFAPDGTVASVLVFSRDVTERKQTEIALRENKTRFREVLEHSFDAAYRRNLKTDTYDYMSPAFTRISGYTPDEMKAMPIGTVLRRIHSDDLEETERILAKSMSAPGKFFCMEYRFRHKDGRYRWFQDKVSVVCDEQGNLLFRVGNVSDITQHKQAEAALRESERKYRMVADFTYDWEFWLAPDGNYVYVSPACERITGYTPDEFRASPQLMTEIIHPDDKGIAVEHLTRGKTENPIEFRIIARDGTQRWIGHVCQPVYDSDGKLLGQRGSNRDITERKQAEKALRDNEDKYRTIFETASEGICQLDGDFNIRLANRKMAEMLGYTVEELSGRSIFEFIDNHHVISQKRESCFRRKDGSELWAIFSGKPVMNDAGQFSFGLLMLTDITERKQAEEQLQKSKQILQTMIDLNSEAVFLMDFNGTVLAANRTLASRLGRDVSRIIGSNIYDLLPPDLREKRRGYIKELIRTGERAYYEDQRDGRHIGNYINPEIDEHGQVTRISVLGVDITERKNYENMLRQNGERYRTFVETMNEGFIVFGSNMEIAYVNEKFCQMTGYGKEELVGKTILHHFDEDNQRIIKEQFGKRRNREVAPYQVKFIRKDGSRIFITISPKAVFDSEGNFQGSFAAVNDITSEVEKETLLMFEHQVMKKQVEVAEIQMKDLGKEVEEYNHALKVLLKNSQTEQKKIEETIFFNIRETIDPFIDKLKNTRLNENQKNVLDVIETNLNNLVSPFVGRLKSELRDFTPMEIHVANLIKEGKENKEISDILNISEYTVMFHRKNIREKLGLKHQKMNLRTYLLSLN